MVYFTATAAANAEKETLVQELRGKEEEERSIISRTSQAEQEKNLEVAQLVDTIRSNRERAKEQKAREKQLNKRQLELDRFSAKLHSLQEETVQREGRCRNDYRD